MGTSQQQAALYEPIAVGESHWTHARSLFRAQETACGLQSQGGAFLFTKTDKPIDCPFCQAAMRPRVA